eukprot:357480_1
MVFFVFVHLHSHFTLSFLPVMAWQEASIIITLILYSSIFFFSYIILINTHIPIDTLVKSDALPIISRQQCNGINGYSVLQRTAILFQESGPKNLNLKTLQSITRLYSNDICSFNVSPSFFPFLPTSCFYSFQWCIGCGIY